MIPTGVFWIESNSSRFQEQVQGQLHGLNVRHAEDLPAIAEMLESDGQSAADPDDLIHLGAEHAAGNDDRTRDTLNLSRLETRHHTTRE